MALSLRTVSIVVPVILWAFVMGMVFSDFRSRALITKLEKALQNEREAAAREPPSGSGDSIILTGGKKPTPEQLMTVSRKVFARFLYDRLPKVSEKKRHKRPVKRVRNITEAVFANYVRTSRPVIVADVVRDMPAFAKWKDFEYLRALGGDEEIECEVSKGNNFFDVDGGFSKVVKVPFSRMMDAYIKHPHPPSPYYFVERPVPDSLKKDLVPPKFASWLQLDSNNIFMGTGDQVSRFHTDSFENLLCQVFGKKHVWLASPFNHLVVYSTTKRPNYSDVDPRAVNYTEFPYFKHVHLHEVTLEGGDCLFIPAYTWHYIQSGKKNLAVNYWYEPQSIFADHAQQFLLGPGQDLGPEVEPEVEKAEGDDGGQSDDNSEAGGNEDDNSEADD